EGADGHSRQQVAHRRRHAGPSREQPSDQGGGQGGADVDQQGDLVHATPPSSAAGAAGRPVGGVDQELAAAGSGSAAGARGGGGGGEGGGKGGRGGGEQRGRDGERGQIGPERARVEAVPLDEDERRIARHRDRPGLARRQEQRVVGFRRRAVGRAHRGGLLSG